MFINQRTYWVIRPQLKKLITNLKDEQKIQLIIVNKFISSNNIDDMQMVFLQSENIKIMRGKTTNKIIDKIFQSLCKIYLESVQALRGSYLAADGIEKL